jgi:hypothetical protein
MIEKISPWAYIMREQYVNSTDNGTSIRVISSQPQESLNTHNLNIIITFGNP